MSHTNHRRPPGRAIRALARQLGYKGAERLPLARVLRLLSALSRRA